MGARGDTRHCVQAALRLQPHGLSGASSSLPWWFACILPWEPDTDQLPTRPQTGRLIKACDPHNSSWYLWAAAPPAPDTQPSGGSALPAHRPASAPERGMNQGSRAWGRGPRSTWGPPDTSCSQELTQPGGEEGVTGRTRSCVLSPQITQLCPSSKQPSRVDTARQAQPCGILCTGLHFRAHRHLGGAKAPKPHETGQQAHRYPSPTRDLRHTCMGPPVNPACLAYAPQVAGSLSMHTPAHHELQGRAAPHHRCQVWQPRTQST